MDNLFLDIFQKYKDDVFRLSYSYTKMVADAEDITQSVFIKLYKQKELLTRQEEEIKKWLVRVTINECKSLYNSFWKRKTFSFKQEDENKIVSNTQNNDVLVEVLSLPKKYRIVIYLYYYENYKLKEISKILNLSETNVQTILFRARRMLKEKLKDGWFCEE